VLTMLLFNYCTTVESRKGTIHDYSGTTCSTIQSNTEEVTDKAKDNTPSSLQHLDTLLDGTFLQVCHVVCRIVCNREGWGWGVFVGVMCLLCNVPAKIQHIWFLLSNM